MNPTGRRYAGFAVVNIHLLFMAISVKEDKSTLMEGDLEKDRDLEKNGDLKKNGGWEKDGNLRRDKISQEIKVSKSAERAYVRDLFVIH